MSENRITDLELRLAYLEKIQEEQNQVIFDQQQTMEVLRKELEQLQGRFKQLRENVDTVEEPPPHY